MTKPMVSVLIPYYNRLELLARSLWLLESQTYENYEVLLIDDGSRPEETLATALVWPRMRYFQLRPPGAPSRSPNMAYWEGYRQAKGEYIVCTHPEIMVPIDAIEKMVDQHEDGRSVPTLFSVPSWRQQHRIDGCLWQENLSTLKLLPDFWAEIGRWGYTNFFAHTYQHHFGFTGQYREEWELTGFIPETQEPRMDDSWIHPLEVESGRVPVHMANIECYHQWHPPLPHQNSWSAEATDKSARMKRIIEADKEIAEHWRAQK